MGIYIKGMEMPKEDTKVLMIFPDGNVRIWGTDIDADKWAEAIEVPTPHGRLIDADVLIERYKPDMNRQIYGGNFIFDIEHMPAIIESEGE